MLKVLKGKKKEKAEMPDLEYSIHIGGLNEETIKRDGEVVADAVTDGLMLVFNSEDNHTSVHITGKVQLYQFGRAIVKALDENEVLGGFFAGRTVGAGGDNGGR